MAKDIRVTLELDSKQYTSSIKSSTAATDRFAQNSRASFTKVAGAIAGVVAAAKGLHSVGTVGAKFQDLQDSLNAVFGSAVKGAQAFDRIKKFSLQTQFGVDTLTNAFIQLKGAGVEPTEELLMTFADTASVTTDQMGTFQAALDLVSRSTAGGLGLEDLNRLADRGIPVFQILQEQLGLTRLEVSEFGKTTQGANEIITALTDGLNERFGGTLQTKLDNVSVKFSNLGIAVQNLAAEIFEKLEPALDRILTSLTDATTKATEFVSTFDDLGQVFEDLAAKVGPVLDKIDQFGAILASLLAPALVSGVTLITRRIVGVAKAIVGIVPVLGRVFAAFISVRNVLLAGLGLVIIKTIELVGNLTTVDDTFRNKLVVGMKIFANTTLGILRGLGEAFLQLLVGPAQEIGKFFSDPLNYELPSIGEMGTKLAEKFNEGFKKGASLFEIPVEYKEIQESFQSLGSDTLSDFFDGDGGITDMGFIYENAAEKVSQSAVVIEDSNKKITDSLAKLTEQIATNFKDAMKTANKALSEDLADALLEGKNAMDSFKSYFKTLVKQLIADAIRLFIVEKILSAVFGFFVPGKSLTFKDGLPTISASGKAVGGQVMANKPYLVGERGPELFVPTAGGSITRNDQLMGGTTVNYNIQAVDAQSFQQLVARDPEFIFAVTEAGRRRLPA
jgi:hypothetical protein